jgi:hypothetical protein
MLVVQEEWKYALETVTVLWKTWNLIFNSGVEKARNLQVVSPPQLFSQFCVLSKWYEV